MMLVDTITLRVLDWLLIPIVLLFIYIYRRSTRISLDNIPGPKSHSFIFGNLSELLCSEVGQTDSEWRSKYGPVYKVTAPFGEPMLEISDPKALHHIFQASGYKYYRMRTGRLLGQAFTGPGLTTVEGEVHRRQRRLMQPSFGASESKALLPIFLSCAAKMSGKWTELVSASAEDSVVLDLPSWVSRATLDAIGLAAFDYEFGALDNADNELSGAYKNFFQEAFGAPSRVNILTMSILQYLPESIVRQFFWNVNVIAKSPRLNRLRDTYLRTKAVAKRLIEEKAGVIEADRAHKDVMSLIVKANSSENPKSQLSEDEMYGMMHILILAGHETTANSLGWTVLELSKHPQAQIRLREEIRATERMIRARGDTEFTAQDLELMPYLTSVVKEILRLHPAVPNIQREAETDDVLPLSQPITSEDGEVLHNLPIPKGTKIRASISVYNRLSEVFGEDAHSFNPDRWLKDDEGKRGTPIGVYANLFTFSAGNKSCLGWRFAVLELQAFIVNIVGRFELSLAVSPEKIHRVNCGVMIPTVEGELEKGCQLPVRIKFANREE